MHKIKYMDTKYWEFSLYFPRELLCYFDTLKKELKSILSEESNCVNISLKENKYCFLLAMTKEIYHKNLSFLKDRIAEIIMIYYKPKIIINSIKNLNLKSHDNVILIDILTSFDFEEDKNKIISVLSLCEKLFLDSFVNFKLKDLILSWKETGDLINQNSLFMIDKSIKLELIQFLMNGISSKIDTVKIKTAEDKILLNEKLCKYPLSYSLQNYDGALFQLIRNYPQRIEVEDYKNFDVNFIQNLHELFAEKVSFVE